MTSSDKQLKGNEKMAIAEHNDVMSVSDIVGTLSETTVGLAMHKRRWSIRKALTTEQKKLMADGFHADAESVSGTKKLLDTRNEAYRDVNRILTDAYLFWTSRTIPYPQHGIRLIKKDKVVEFDRDFLSYQNRLALAVDDLNRELPAIIEQQRTKLGDLFSMSDYPRTVEGMYELSYDVHSIKPPSYLAQLEPELFAEQMQRAQDRIQHSISLLENEFLSEIQKFTEQLIGGLTKTESGRRKTVRESTIDRLNTFFSRFQSLNLSSSGQLNQLVSGLKDVMAGRDLKDLRKHDQVRAEVRTQLAKLQGEVDRMIETRSGRQFDLAD
jgi:hypothetical protein